MDREQKVNTKLFVDYGHVWDSLVTVVITFTIKIFGAYINGGYFQRRFCTYLRIHLPSTRIITSIKLLMRIKVNIDNETSSRNCIN